MASDRRSLSLSPPEMYLLRWWGEALWRAFGVMPYLVGSVMRAEPWRDVDVRCLLDQDCRVGATDVALPALNTALSVWGQRVTGLPIDFQFQRSGEFHAHDGEKRNPIFVIEATE